MIFTASLMTAALAGPYLGSPATPVDLGQQGRHAWPVVRDGQPTLFYGRGGNLKQLDLVVEGAGLSTAGDRVLLNGGDWVDQGIAPCPDGGLLHVASQHGAQLDDSAIATRLDADLQQVHQRQVLSDGLDWATNDMAVLCADGLEGVAFAERGAEGKDQLQYLDDVFLPLDAAFWGGADPEQALLSPSTRMTGNSLHWDAEAQELWAIGWLSGPAIKLARFNADLTFLGRDAVEVLEADAGVDGYWPRDAEPVQGSLVVAHMLRSPGAFEQDTGEVGLFILGPDQTVVDQVQLTNYASGMAAMRPGLALHGDTLVVAWDVDGQLVGTTVPLDVDALAALASPEGPDGGCTQGGAWLLLPLLGIGRRYWISQKSGKFSGSADR